MDLIDWIFLLKAENQTNKINNKDSKFQKEYHCSCDFLLVWLTNDY